MFLVTLIGAAALPCWGQSPSGKPSVTDVLTKLQSKEWTERSTGIEEIYDNPDVLHSPKLKEELIDLLDKENKENRRPDESANAQAAKPIDASAARAEDDSDEEEFAWYFSKLGEIVGSFVNWTDPHQACIMVNAAWVDYETSAAEAAFRAKAAMPCILKMAEDHQTIYRHIAIPMLVEALARGKDALDSEAIRKAKQIILNDLHDSDAGLRSGTVIALGDYGEADVIPTLKQIARSDPTFEKTDNGGQWFLIRDDAVKAIAAIQNREAPQ
jgi:hypothetical protein